jgi:hypothetical protein
LELRLPNAAEDKMMKIRDLASNWEKHASGKMAAREFSVKLPIHDAARIMALAEMYPARTESQIITELLSAALDELIEAFPYAKGEKVIAEDEYNDPIYEDAGLTPVFFEITNKFMHQLESGAENTPDRQRK